MQPSSFASSQVAALDTNSVNGQGKLPGGKVQLAGEATATGSGAGCGLAGINSGKLERKARRQQEPGTMGAHEPPLQVVGDNKLGGVTIYLLFYLFKFLTHPIQHKS